MKRPTIIGIAGASCAGKTCLSHALVKLLPDAAVLAMDRYYRDLGALCLEERAQQNFDHPDALEWPRLLRDVGALAQGQDVMVPIYNYAYHEREAIEAVFSARDIVIVEGLYALYAPELRALYTVAVFIEHTSAGCMSRRLKRDVASRGRSQSSVVEQFENTVWPMYAQFVAPTRQWADLVLRGDQRIDDLVDAVARALH